MATLQGSGSFEPAMLTVSRNGGYKVYLNTNDTGDNTNYATTVTNVTWED